MNGLLAMNLRWIKYLALPFMIPRIYKINELLWATQDLIFKGAYSDALRISRSAVELSRGKYFKYKYCEARIFEGLALLNLKQREEAAKVFSAALSIVENAKNMSEPDKTYLRLYCYSFFKEGAWPQSLQRSSVFPVAPKLSDVSIEIAKKFPFEDYPGQL
jgi:hypothetical protein